MSRFYDVELEKKGLGPIGGYWAYPLVSLDKALEFLSSQIEQLDYWIKQARMGCHFPSENGLTRDESASIYLYTMEAHEYSIYRLLNKVLRDNDRNKIKPWFSYLKLFTTALNKLPTVKTTIWRGVCGDVKDSFTENESLTWWSVSSCSKSLPVVKSFLNSNTNNTLFLIEAINGKELSDYSAYKTEEEIILGPGTRLCTKTKMLHSDLQVVHLEEILDDYQQVVDPKDIIDDKINSKTIVSTSSSQENQSSKQQPKLTEAKSQETTSIKIVVIGNEGVGKTYVIQYYIRPQDKYNICMSTVFENHTYETECDGKNICLDIVDTPGSEDFDRIRSLAYSKADIFLICFSIVQPDSFNDVKKKWIPEVKKYCPDTPYILVGTMSDLRTDKSEVQRLAYHGKTLVFYEDGLELSKQIGAYKYFECSISSPKEIELVFEEAIRCILTAYPETTHGTVTRLLTKFFRSSVPVLTTISSLEIPENDPKDVDTTANKKPKEFELIWLDATADESKEDFKTIILALKQIVPSFNLFCDVDQCHKFINQHETSSILIISSGSLGKDIVPKIHKKPQVTWIYIYCSNRSFHEEWALKWRKVNGVFTGIEPIYSALRQYINQST